MLLSETTAWLQFALQQMAAESYLDGIDLSNNAEVMAQLRIGNNRLGFEFGATKFTGAVNLELQDHAFIDRYQIVSHHSNDSTGFSATLIQERESNNFTLSFRSTEYQPLTNGGDRQRDLFGADAEISLGGGFAIGQLLAMENYYQSLKDSGLLPTGAVLNVTGYSLGGHLATVFTELHTVDINHTYTFNGVGRGHITGGLPTETTEGQKIAGMLALFNHVLFNPDAGLDILNDRDNVAYNAAKQTEGQPFTPFVSDTAAGSAGSLYGSARYGWAAQVVAVRYHTSSVSLPPGEVGIGPAFSPDKFTQLYGRATQDDNEYVANSGVHGPAQSIYIEDQPNFDGIGGFFGANGDYGTTHSITLIVDSLATQELFQTIAPTLTQSEIEAIFAAASNQRASGFVGVSGTAEGNSLENALDVLGKLFVQNYTQTASGRQTGDFGSLSFRNPFYENLAAIRASLANTTITIEPFVEMGLVDGQRRALPRLTEIDLVAEARQDTDRGLAFRYALKNLNPFAVIGADYHGLGHTSNGELALFDSATGLGEMTEQYLIDRAAFLESRIELNLTNRETSGDTTYFKDFAGASYEIRTGSFFGTDRQYLFGSNGDEQAGVLVGLGKDDHLYGGAGNDVLEGNGGEDYLEGNADDDELFGGGGIDRLYGQQGDDVLDGGADNDILDGGADNDTLRGGSGIDAYRIYLGDGADTIEDSDGRGMVEFEEKVLSGALRRSSDPANVYRSSDGTITYTQQGNDLVVTGSGGLTIRNFSTGQFGIRLVEEHPYGADGRTDFLKIDHYEFTPDGLVPFYVAFFDDSSNDTRVNHEVGRLVPDINDESNVIRALGGNDYVVTGDGDDQLYGEAGDDQLFAGLGNDRLFGGADVDILVGDDGEFLNIGGNDYLDGGDGDDLLQGSAGQDILLGGNGNDNLNGDEPLAANLGTNDDWLDGGADDDELHGSAGSDVLIGGSGNDLLIGDTTPSQGGDPAAGAADSLDGGTGDDTLFGLYGADLLDGGNGNDRLNGQDGDDVLYGGEGNDTLSGDLRVDPTTGLYDTSENRNAGGHDLLYGGQGLDFIYGGEGRDILIGGEGNDHLYGGYNPNLFFGGDLSASSLMDADEGDWIEGGAGNDHLYGGGGDDELMGGNEADVLSGENGNDFLEGGDGSDLLNGGAGNDVLEGGDGADQLHGEDGDDTLMAGVGADFLDGGTGFDFLFGGAGDDTYVVDADGDQIFEEQDGGLDLVQSFVSYSLADNVENLTLFGGSIGMGNGTDNVMVGTFGVDLIGNGGDDVLTGWARMDGGTGNDVLNGQELNNAYAFGLGGGRDAVIEMSVDPFINLNQADEVQMGAGVHPGDVTWFRSGDDLVIGINGTGDQMTIQSYYKLMFSSGDWRFISGLMIPSGDVTRQNSANPYFYAPGEIEIVRFADGTIWGPGAFGGFVTGSAASDMYQFGRGSGQLTIVEFDHLNGALDTLELGPGIATDEIILEKSGLDLKLRLGDTADVATVSSYFSVVIGNSRFSSSLRSYATPHKIDQVVFSDGTVWDSATLESQMTLFTGTNLSDPLVGNDLSNTMRGLDGNDVMSGRSGSDILDGGGGNDDLDGDQGEDVLIGASGNDFLFGGSGNDTYVFNLGDGMDTIADVAASGEGNRIQFGAGIAQSDLAFLRDEDARTLLIQVGASGADGLLLTNFDSTGVNGSLVVETFMFVNGSTLDVADLFPLVGNHAPTVAFPVADQTVQEDVPFSFVVPPGTFVDPDAGDVLDLSISQTDGTVLPSWMSFDSVTRTFRGMSDNDQVGTITLRITASDQDHESVSDEFTFTVTNVNDAPTVAGPLAGQMAIEDAIFTFEVPAATFMDVDQRHGDILTFEASLSNGGLLPGWLTFDAGTNTFSGVPSNGEVGTVAITVTATDSEHLGIATGFSLVVQNTNDAPAVTMPLSDQAAAEDAPFSFWIPDNTFADPDHIHGDVLNYTATLADGSGLPEWLTFNPGTHTFSGMPGPGDAGSLPLTVTATDTGNLSVSDTFALAISGPLPKILVGTFGNDFLTGGRGDDTLTGLAGNDRLQGGSGSDLLDGGTGADTMQGGTGNDVFIVDVPGDVASELPNEGTDTVQAGVTHTLSINVENLTLTGAWAISGTGNALNNHLVGNSGNNTLSGRAGNDRLDGGLGSDVMIGGTGDDTYVISQAGDSVTEALNEGTDTVESSIGYALNSNVENLILTGTADINGTGSSANNVLTGNSGRNTLTGGSGNDTVHGGSGDDSLFGGSGTDQLFGGQGDDLLNGGSGNDLLNGGDGVDILDGGSGDDQLVGGAGNDMLAGGSGADQFTGGIGNDTVTGGSGNDLYHFSLGDGQDRIVDSDPFQGNVDRLVFGTMVSSLDLIVSRQANDLRLAIHGSTDSVTIQNWYTSPTTNQVEDLQAGSGLHLMNTQVDQLIQSMAGFTQQTGLTWDQAIEQRPLEVQTILAASWQ